MRVRSEMRCTHHARGPKSASGAGLGQNACGGKIHLGKSTEIPCFGLGCRRAGSDSCNHSLHSVPLPFPWIPLTRDSEAACPEPADHGDDTVLPSVDPTGDRYTRVWREREQAEDGLSWHGNRGRRRGYRPDSGGVWDRRRRPAAVTGKLGCEVQSWHLCRHKVGRRWPWQSIWFHVTPAARRGTAPVPPQPNGAKAGCQWPDGEVRGFPCL